MEKILAKISLIILIGIILSACKAEKRVPEGKFLLSKNKLVVNNKKNTEENITNQLYQKPNGKLLGFRLRLNLYNWANLNPDSTYQAKFINDPERYSRESKWLSAKQVNRLGKSFWYHGIHDFLKKTGEPPVIFDSIKTTKSIMRLKYYYFNNGYFNVKADYEIVKKSKKADVNYTINTGNIYLIDTVSTKIKTPILDSLYESSKKLSLLKSGQPFKTINFEEEKNRIATHFRNNGAYTFQPTYINFDIDTIQKKDKANVSVLIDNFSYQDKDSTHVVPFKIYKISEVNIYTDHTANNNTAKPSNLTKFRHFNLFSHEKLKYRPKALTDGVFISKGSLFSDTRTTLTSRYLSNLRVFNYPSIQYEIDPRDSTKTSLIAKIYLTQRKKYSFGMTADATHSNIQDIGIAFSPTFSARNVFRGAETFEISTHGNIGSSRSLANPNNQFFNVSEFGLDLKLNFPRILMPFRTEKIIPKKMIPSTLITTGFNSQKNIGLDKENFTGALTYSWTPKKNNSAKFDLFNAQFVRNLNVQNYYNVYTNSYNALNTIGKTYNTTATNFNTDGNLKIDSGTTNFTSDVLNEKTDLKTTSDEYKTVRSIEERRIRLTENDFILATSFTLLKNTKTDLQDNEYYIFKTKIESAGSLLSLISSASNLPTNATGKYEIFNLNYSEYIKTEFDFIKHWDLGSEKKIAFRSFFGIAIPFGNSTSIPFTRSYFAGGSNDNRAWQPYSLGPGASGSTSDFNEANMKLAISTEFRFKIFEQLKGAVFADGGNIWNVFDNVTEEKSIFKNVNSLSNIALGTGFGLRYDLSFFVIRFDFGFKTYNPANETGEKWFNEYSFSKSVLNFGINYPF